MTEIKEFLKSETKISKDCRVKYWLFCKILDYLLANQFYIGKDYVSYKDIHTYLDKQCTFDYIDSIHAQTELWVHEMLWLGLINFDENSQQMSLTPEGYKACGCKDTKNLGHPSRPGEKRARPIVGNGRYVDKISKTLAAELYIGSRKSVNLQKQQAGLWQK